MMTCNSLPFIVSDLFQTTFWNPEEEEKVLDKQSRRHSCGGTWLQLPWTSKGQCDWIWDDSIWVRYLNDGTMQGNPFWDNYDLRYYLSCFHLWTFSPCFQVLPPWIHIFWLFVSSRCKKKVKLLYFEGCPSWHYFVIVSDDISSGSIYGIYFLTFYSGILSDTLFWHSVQFYSGILPSIYSDILFGVLSGIYSDIFSGILSGIHSIWYIFGDSL